jgi:hypothetical protein
LQVGDSALGDAAYKLNHWLLLFNRTDTVETDLLRHMTLTTARLRLPSAAAQDLAASRADAQLLSP